MNPDFSLPVIPNNSVPSSITSYNLPSVLLPLVTDYQLPPVSEQSISLPSISYNLPSTFPETTSIGLPNFLGSYIPVVLADNERGDLNWNRPNPPDQSYKRIGVIGDGSCFFHAIAKMLAGTYQLSYNRSTQVPEETLQQFENSIQSPNLFNPHTFRPVRNSRKSGIIYTIHDRNMYEKSMLTFRSVFVRLLRENFAQQLLTNQYLRNVVVRRLAGEIDVQTQVIQYLHPNIDIVQVKQLAFDVVINDLVKELLSMDAVDARYALLMSEYYDVDIYVIVDEELTNQYSRNAILSEYYNSAIQGPRVMRPENDPNGQKPSRYSTIMIHVAGGHFEVVGNVNPETGFITTNFKSDDPFIRQLYSILLDVRNTY